MKRCSAISLMIAVGGYFCFPSLAYSSNNSVMNVQIVGIKDTKGQVCFSLFAESEGFPDSIDNSLQAKCLPVQKRSPILTINNLHPGNYALAVFHDVNGDGKFNRNFWGIPREGFGFSRNPEIKNSPPNFEESAVFVNDTKTNLQVQLRYF
jgi:uncharacterized protein (DUF2141 family)